MEHRFFGRVGWLVSRGIVLTIALAIALVGMTQAASSVFANGGGGQPRGGYVGGPPLTAQQQRQLATKEAAVAKWVANGSAYNLTAIKRGVSVTQASNITRKCISDPNTGNCATWITVSVGGQYTIEPSQEPNWCGPGAGTAVALHWNANSVNNHASVTVHADPNAPWYGAWITLSGAQAWMGDFAQQYYVDNQYGVEPYPSTGASTGVMRDALNNSLGTGGYYITLGNASITQESNLYGNATYDIGHDGHPMIFLVDAAFLQEWPYQSTPINHYIEGYAYGYWSDYNSNASNKIYYADTASTSDQGTAGDYSTTYDDFWNHPWLGHGYSGEPNQTAPEVIIV
jgi:hypothetical protein